MAIGKFSGAEKAAILLMTLGEELASEVAKHLSPQEIQHIGTAIAKKDSVTASDGRYVVNEFVQHIGAGGTSIEGLNFAKNLMTRALGADEAQYMLEQIIIDIGEGGIDTIKLMDPALIADTIKGEHPQIISLLLVHLDPDCASQVLLNIPDEKTRGEVMLRIATLTRIPEAAVKDLEVMLSKQMVDAKGGSGDTVEGIKVAAEILNKVGRKYEEEIMGIIEKASPDIANSIQEKMFVFADLLTIDEKGIQLVIKELTTDVLVAALKGADEEIANKFYDNISGRAADILKEHIEAKGPMRLSDVEEAQLEVIGVARRLEHDGKIVRVGDSGDIVV